MGTKVYDNYADLITFNRNSKGTALRPIGYGDELVTNGDGSTISGWNVQFANTTLSTSSGSLVATADASGPYGVSQQLPSISTGTVLAITATIDVDNASGGTGNLRISTSANLTISQTTIAQTTGTHTFYYVTATAGPYYIGLVDTAGAAGDSMSFDNISVKEVLFDREGDPLTLFLHPEGVPRIEYDADRNLKGLLIEPDGQNAMFPSIPDTTWSSTSGVTITTDDAVAPDGTTTATKLEGTGNWLYRNNITGTNTGTWTVSCWVKAVTVGTNNTFRLAVGGNNLSSDLTATGEWQRFEFTYTDGGGTVNGFLRDSSSNDSDLYIWGAQVETGPIATSYMPTTGSPFTRDRDDASMTNVSGLIGQKEGTLYVEVDWRLAGGGSQWLLSASDGSDDNRVEIIISDPNQELRMIAFANGSQATAQGQSYSTYSGIQKIAFAYKTNDFELYRNGSSISSYTSGSLTSMATLDTVALGQRIKDGSNDLQANMWIRAIQIIPRRLSDEQLIELTS
jgi:hypothetical protein